MSLRALELLLKHDIIAYALSTQTIGKTKPLEVILFAVFKTALNDAIYAKVNSNEVRYLDMFNYCTILGTAYYRSFTRYIIAELFSRAGLLPLNPLCLRNTPRPRYFTDLGSVFGPNELIQMYEKKRQEARNDSLGKMCQLSAQDISAQRAVPFGQATLQCMQYEKTLLDDVKRSAEHDLGLRSSLCAEKCEEIDSSSLLRKNSRVQICAQGWQTYESPNLEHHAESCRLDGCWRK